MNRPKPIDLVAINIDAHGGGLAVPRGTLKALAARVCELNAEAEMRNNHAVIGGMLSGFGDRLQAALDQGDSSLLEDVTIALIASLTTMETP